MATSNGFWLPSSSELMTASKFIGREFLKCKMAKGEHLGLCVKEGDLVRLCTKNGSASPILY
jgi:hypothetical protein